MLTSEINISKVIEEGKLKTYFFGVSFIEAYWSPDGQTNLTLTVTSNDGGTFGAVINTSEPTEAATTTHSNPSQSGDVKVSTSGTVVSPRVKNNGAGKAVNQ